MGMTGIVIILPKKRMNDANNKGWKHNPHIKPFCFTSEVNKAIRDGRLEKWVGHILFRKECYGNRYRMGRWE